MIHPVILCGGAGTRLWPLSRARLPKQLLPLAGDRSLLQDTAARVAAAEFAPAIIVSSEDQGYLVRRQLEEVDAAVAAILLEPAPRNTSAAAALAATWLLSTNRDDLLLLLPADHVILDQEAFLRAVSVGVLHAEAGAILTFGAEPSEANTQYGYIEARSGDPSGDGALPIIRFVEKPDQAKAAEYLARGGFYWNAGIFLVKASVLVEEMRRFLPGSLDAISMSVANATQEAVFVRPDAGFFKRAISISIDHGIMEKTSRGMVVPVQMKWSDVGAWDAVWKLRTKDTAGNAIQGDAIAVGSRDCFIRCEEGSPLVAAVGLEKMAVIATSDAVLVSPLDRVAEVKHVVESLKSEGRECVVSPRKQVRPWGSEESLSKGGRFQVNHTILDPGARMVLHSYEHRSAHWIVVSGSAELTNDGAISKLEEDETICIRAGANSSIANIGEVPLELLEVKLMQQS